MSPPSALAYGGLGHTLQQLNRHEDAIVAYQPAIELDPSLVRAHSDLGFSLYALERYDDATFAYRRVLAHDPADANAAANLALTLTVLDRHEEAVNWYKRALTLAPDGATARSLGIALADLDRFPEAEEAFRDALRHLPSEDERHEVVIRLAVCLAEMERYDDAMSLLDGLAEAGLDNACTRSTRSIVLLLQGRIEDACAMAASAISQTPEYPDAYVAMGWIRLEAGEGAGAIASFEQGLKNGAEPLAYKLGMACSFSSLGRYREAIDLFDEVLETRPLILKRHQPSAKHYDRARRALDGSSP